MRTYLITVFLVTSFFIQTATSQVTDQQIDMRIDSIGDAHLKVSMEMNAQQWEGWVQSYGNNPAALKREMERALPSYFLDDFKFEKDDMNRSFELTFKAYGACDVDRKGRWTMNTETKDANVTELTERKFMMVESPQEYGGSIRQTTTVTLPNQAENVKIDTDAFGKTVFVFEMDEPGGGMNYTQWAGIFLLVVGAGATAMRARG
ncbi:hypothetical protein [Halocola ammonii]